MVVTAWIWPSPICVTTTAEVEAAAWICPSLICVTTTSPLEAVETDDNSTDEVIGFMAIPKEVLNCVVAPSRYPSVGVKVEKSSPGT